MPNLEMPIPKQFLKVAEVAELLNVKPRTIYEMVAQNRIPYRKPPGSNILRFDLEEILEWTRGKN
jgi:excisionase family DNA binding protein